jgi:hypothetical protein
MGLDVYLERCDNWADKIRLEQKFNDTIESKEIDYHSTEWKDLSDSLGLLDGYYNTDKIEIDSTVDPKHLMKIGYFRSSYNGSGLNSVLEDRIGGKDLYYIFPHEREAYMFVPDWPTALVRCNEVIEEFNENLKTTGKYSVIAVSPNMFRTPEISSDKEALETFLVEINRENKLGGWYSNISGQYFSEGINVRAAIEGLGMFGKSTIFLVYENTKETADWKWYTDALLIVKETIFYVLGQDDPTKYGLIWSS